jgi:hypothetical protein
MGKKSNKEVEIKEKAGTAWSHSYLNQKPWHPLSYPNQRRKWIAEQTHAQKEERRAEVAREVGSSFISSKVVLAWAVLVHLQEGSNLLAASVDF